MPSWLQSVGACVKLSSQAQRRQTEKQRQSKPERGNRTSQRVENLQRRSLEQQRYATVVHLDIVEQIGAKNDVERAAEAIH